MREAKRTFAVLPIITGFFLLMAPLSLWAQPIEIGVSSDTACFKLFVDNGGLDADYPANSQEVSTLCSEDPTDTHTLIKFHGGVNLAAGDTLYFYDGNNTAAPLLLKVHANTPRETFTVEATVGNASGCLTVEFRSDGAAQAPGWVGAVQCRPRCQTVLADIISTDPAINPADTGWIDICIGDQVDFSGNGIFPENDSLYNQSDATSTFNWDFGDGGKKAGQNVSHVFQREGGYLVSLTVTDVRGCSSTNEIRQRIRVAPKPEFSIAALPPPFCPGDSVSLDAGINLAPGSAIVSAQPGTGTFLAGGIRADSLPLPDGIGVSYETSIELDQFEPGVTLTDIAQLEGICINMEHSFMGDLSINIICPNGQTVNFVNYRGSDFGHSLGVPVFDPDEPSGIIPGQGFTYCWTPDAVNDSWELLPETVRGATTIPPGNYQSGEPLNQLVGCPLNGEWTIEVRDNIAQDNGFIFNWAIQFSSNLVQDPESFSPNLLSGAWVNDPENISQYDPTTIVAKPSASGEVYYTYETTDDFGCSADTSIALEVLSPLNAACSNCVPNPIPFTDTILCQLDSIQVNVEIQNDVEDSIKFYTNPSLLVDDFTSALSSPFQDSLTITDIAAATITDPALLFGEVCINLETDATDDLIVQLEAPDGKLLTLVSKKGNGANFTNTCFSPNATQAIGAGAAPFTGTYLPDTSFNTLIGSPINGAWKLRVLDDGQLDTKVLKDWSISFLTNQAFTYSWAPTDGLSCSDCPNPIIKPNTSTNYLVTINDASGCTITDTLNVTVQPVLAAPDVSVSQVNGQNLEFEWPGLPQGTQYEYQVTRDGNPEGWVQTTETSLTFNNLPGGTSITVEVRQFDAVNACPAEVKQATGVVIPCNLAPNPAIFDIVCNGDLGRIQLSPTGNNGPVTFELIPGGIINTTGNFPDLAPGTYTVSLTDSLGCPASFNRTLTEPTPLVTNATLVRRVSCSDKEDGIATVEVTGGEPAYNILWVESGLLGVTVDSLAAGLQTVQITDSRGCISTSQVLIPGPDPINLSIVKSDPTCADTNDGSLTATAFKSTGEQIFLNWDNGQTGQTINNLTPGIYCVTATDLFGCTVSICDTLIAPPPLVIDSLTTSDASCADGTDGRATVFASGGRAPYSFSWNDPLNQQNSQASSLEEGMYTVTVTDNGGCAVSAQIVISEPLPLQAQLSLDPVICRGDSTGQATVLAEGGTAPYQYEWSDGTAGNELLNLPAGAIDVIVTDTNGCSLQVNGTITQPATNLDISIDQTRIGCQGDSGNVVVGQVLENPGNTALTFAWSNGASANTLTNLLAGPIGLRVTDELGCTDFDSIIVQDLAPIEFSIQANRPSCPGVLDGSLGVAIITGGSGSQAADYQFLWNTGDTGPVITGLAGGQVYEVTVTDSVGCFAIEERLLAEPKPVDFDLLTEDVLCAGESTGQAVLSNIVSESNTFTIEWDQQLNGVAGQIADELAAGTYNVAILDINNCRVDTTFTINEPNPLAIQLQTEDNVCFGDSLGSVSAIVSGGVPGYQLEWSNGNTSSVIQNLEADFYTLTVTDSNGCTISETTSISEPTPIFLEAFAERPSCNRLDDGFISLSAAGGNGPYLFGINGSALTPDSIFSNLVPGDYTVTVQDAFACETTEVVTINEPQEILVDLGTEVIFINPGDTVQLPAQIITTDGIVSLEWVSDNLESLSCTDCLSPFAFPAFTTLYTLNVVDEAGCEGTGRIRVQVSKRNLAIVPTGFTPNQDLQNDRLIVHGDQGVQIMSFRVFNRWGEQVFENNEFTTNSEADGWDGSFKGKPSPAGIYLWVLEVEFQDGTQQVLKGQTTLIR